MHVSPCQTRACLHTSITEHRTALSFSVAIRALGASSRLMNQMMPHDFCVLLQCFSDEMRVGVLPLIVCRLQRPAQSQSREGSVSGAGAMMAA
jgi:hypothetical protein